MDVLNSFKYAFYILRHPFDGFWCLKSEKRGSLKASGLWMAALLISMIVRMYGGGYLVGGLEPEKVSVWLLLLIIVGVYLLFCVANWSLTTLMDGSGTFGEIVIANVYALVPVILVNVPLSLISHLLTEGELAFYTLFSGFSIAWSVFLMLAANMSTHDYSMAKSIFTFILTLVIMVFIVLLGILFLNLLQQVGQFVASVYREAIFRVEVTG